MKTLQAFWRWVDNEKPGTLTIIDKACGDKALTPLARTAIDQAATVVWAMHNVLSAVPNTYTIRTALDNHRDDLRDVSLALLPALEKVNERRGATVRKIVEQRSAHTHAKCGRCGGSGVSPQRNIAGASVKCGRCLGTGGATPEPLPPQARTCVGCGLSSSDEPSVLHPRADGQARCNDCQRNHQWATNEGGRRV